MKCIIRKYSYKDNHLYLEIKETQNGSKLNGLQQFKIKRAIEIQDFVVKKYTKDIVWSICKCLWIIYDLIYVELTNV